MSPRNSVDSLSNVIGDITFVAGDTVYSLPTHEYLQSLTVESTADGTWFADIVLFDVREEIEDLLLSEGYNGKVQFRWGHDDIGGIAGLPLYTGAVARVRPALTPQGTQLRLGLIPDITVAGLVDRRVVGWKAQTPMSDIVAQIAELRGYKTRDSKGRATIQPVNASRPDVVSMMGESDLKFLRDHIVPYAVDAAGRGGFEVYVDESNALHFHNDYFNPRVQALRYTVYRDTMGEVKLFEPVLDELFAAVMGASNTTYNGTDSDGGTKTEVKTGSTTGVPGAQTEVMDDASAKYNLGVEAHSRVHLFERDPDLFAARAANQYAQLSRFSCNARLVVRGTHAAVVNDYITVDYFRQSGAKHWLSGNFKVKKIIHTWDSEGWSTDFDLLRDGVAPVAGTVPIQAAIQSAITPTSQTQVAGQAGPPGQAPVDAYPVQGGGESRR